MNRRRVLGAGATAGLTAVAGCLTGLVAEESSDDVVLEQPEEGIEGDPSYPTYGDPFPTFEAEDPLAETTVAVDDLGDDAFVATAFFASCPAECIPLIDSLTRVQDNAADRGLGDESRFLAITFDPERDTAESLREHADMFDVDLEAGNWHYLRPDGRERAKEIVHEGLGIPFQREEMGDDYDFIHITVTFLVNPDGYVERTYRGENPDAGRITDDLERVVDGWQ
ncbi:electron transporter SenC [Halobiforma lacisalsi AJ5]|uniref:Electron transporter SCO1/SenC n=2 Tax=Natronobacterium TaxID=2256 RepID=M0LXX1_NATLA|nr:MULTISPECIES: SCO family protein [Halobiforma]APW97665.1 electron transporter SenC [Halobiforma lacisalsi AJ5]EMA36945.1 electron transporter SCO1/SenC [Halobiforma lacisalsi AJ5]SFB83525.1 protein SCO1/2 [Halobiforma haloterrestris]